MLAAVCAYGWGAGPWFPFFPLAWLLIVVALIWAFGRRSRWSRRAGAEEVLAERYARGEIDADEYSQRLGVLRRRTG